MNYRIIHKKKRPKESRFLIRRGGQQVDAETVAHIYYILATPDVTIREPKHIIGIPVMENCAMSFPRDVHPLKVRLGS